MKILIYDKMQIAIPETVPSTVRSPALSDALFSGVPFTAEFGQPEKIDCVGIGYTDATELTISAMGETRTVEITKSPPYCNGLYLIDPISDGEYYPTEYEINHNGNFIGRIGIGEHRRLGVNPTMEHGFYTTNESRMTESGQIIPGAGGFSGRNFDADIRYKIDRDVYADIESAFNGQISRSFPYFLLTDDEQHKLPENMLRFYASTDRPLSKLQSSTYKFLYSYRFQFQERF